MVAAVLPASVAESASAAKGDSPQHEVLKQVTGLFLANAGRLKESQIGAFDGLLVGRAERDESLTERLGLRLDLPAILLREILSKATDLVLARFLTAPRPVAHGKTQGSGSTPLPRKIDYAEAQSEVLALNRT